MDIDNTLDSHNAFMVCFHPRRPPAFELTADTVRKVDEVVQYIDWAVENKFAVMDINVPSYEENDTVSGDDFATWGARMSR